MLNRSQLNTIGVLRRRPDTFFSSLPTELFIELLKEADTANKETSAKITTLLQHIVECRPKKVKEILDESPDLILYAGNVTTPAGNIILRVTPYECALGAGDPEMASLIRMYFDHVEKDDRERARQYSRYLRHIKKMYQEDESYSFKNLFKLILSKKTSTEEILSVLNHQADENSRVAKQIAKFRADFAPKTITTGMHFHYQNLYPPLKYTSGYIPNKKNNTRDAEMLKLILLWRQVAGYLMLIMPACDQLTWQAGIATTLKEMELNKQALLPNEKSLSATHRTQSQTGLGFDFAYDIHGDTKEEYRFMEPPGVSGIFTQYIKAKQKLLLAEQNPPKATETTKQGLFKKR